MMREVKVAIGTMKLENGEQSIIGIVGGVRYHYMPEFSFWYSVDGKARDYSEILNFAYRRYLLEKAVCD
jgi:hypothetical protein